MNLSPLQGTRLQDRIVVFFVVLLMGVQLASFYFIRYAISETAQSTLREELRLGARVFERLLQQNSRRLVESAAVLTSDFGFRAAVASRDRDTIASALRNHAARINASGVAVVGLDGVVVADTMAQANIGRPYASPGLVALAASVGHASGVRVIDGRPYQAVVVPVLGPLPIAWVSMDFLVDDDAARELQYLSSSEVSFVSIAGPRPRVLATTLPASRRADLGPQVLRIVREGRAGLKVEMGGEEYEALAAALEGGGEGLYTVLQRSVSQGIAPYLALEAALLFIAGLSMAVTFAGAVRIARRITQPVTELADAAREIERGNYGVRVGARGKDEIGDLARAFDGMARGLAERDHMRDVLGKVASTEVVAQLMDGRIELGGAEVEATIVFTDIRNFTSLCETLTPQQSLQMLNTLLTALSEVIEAHGGVVDKYIGDGVMAVFGAPVTRPDDTRRAVHAALEIRRRVALLGPQLAARGLPAPQVGVGLNTARVIAGNIGSPTRLNYTVLGDGVNLAARLEGLTKRYLVPIVAGAATRAATPDVVFREIDKVRVRGRMVAERIYEPLAREGELSAAELERIAEWHRVLELFRSRHWIAAREALQGFAALPAYERLAQLYLGYLRDLEAHPPGEDWDAAFTLYEK